MDGALNEPVALGEREAARLAQLEAVWLGLADEEPAMLPVALKRVGDAVGVAWAVSVARSEGVGGTVGLQEGLPLGDGRGEEQGVGVVDWQCLGEEEPHAEGVATVEPVWLCVGLPLTEALVLTLGHALREPP